MSRLLRFTLCLVLSCGAAYAHARVPESPHRTVIFTIRKARSLTKAQLSAAWNIHVRALVTYYDSVAPNLFVQDKTGGIWVDLRGTNVPHPVPGQLLDLRGVVAAGFTPYIADPTWRVLGVSRAPKPVPVGYEQSGTGAYDSQWISMDGIVRSFAQQAEGDVLVIDVATPTGSFKVRVPDFHSGFPMRLVDAKVRFTGVCGAAFNRRNQLVAVHLFVPDLKYANILDPAPADPFAESVTPIRDIRTFSANLTELHRVKVVGVVTEQFPGMGLYLMDSTGGLYAESQDGLVVQPGDLVEVIGFPAAGSYTPLLKSASVRFAHRHQTLIPAEISGKSALSGGYDAQLVQVSGTVHVVERHTDSSSLLLESDDQVPFEATIASQNVALPEVGSRLRLTGICAVKIDENGNPSKFEIVLRSPADLVLLSSPPWLMGRRGIFTLATLLAFTIAVLAWVLFLRRRVRQQTKLIEARLKRQAALEERYRRVFENSLTGLYLTTSYGVIVDCNDAYARILGYANRKELLECPEEAERLTRQFHGIAGNGNSTNGHREVSFQNRDGSWGWALINSGSFASDDGQQTLVESTVVDITQRRLAETELRRVNRALSTLSRCNEVLVHATDTPQLLEEICDIVVRTGGYRLAWVGFANSDDTKSVRVVAKAGMDEGYVDKAHVTWSDDERGVGPAGSAIRTGKVSILRDTFNAPQFRPWRDSAIARGYASLIGLPLNENGATFGVLCIYSSDPEAFDDEEVALLEELADDLAYGVIARRNVREREQAEDALRCSEERYRFLFEHNPHPMWISDLGTRNFVEVNKTAIERYGYSRKEFAAMTLDDIRPAEDLPVLQAAIKGASPETRATNIVRHRKKDGTVIHAEVVAYRFLQEGRLFSIALSSDISDRVRAEQALRASETRYRMLFEHNLAAVFHSRDGRLLDCNNAMCQMFGYSREEILDLDLRTIYCDLNAREKGQKLLFESGWLANYEVDLRRKDGKTVTVLANLNLLREEPSEAPVVVGVMLDITEVRKLQTQLSQSQKLEALGKLTGGIAHDFNNILMIINSYGEILLSNDGLQDSVRRPIEQIQAAGNRAASLTRQLLAFSRKQVMAPIVLNLAQLVSDFKDMLRRLLGEDVHLDISFPPDLWLTMADPSQIEQVVINVAVNARDAMPAGGKLIIKGENVKLGPDFVLMHPGSKARQYVLLTVTDTGSGIPEDIQSRIFEPFFSTKDPGKGTGLGLSTVYGIVKQSDGYITVESEVGKGTSFRIYLPRAENQQKATVQEKIEPTPILDANILLVEDEDATREALATYLERNGFRVFAASNAHEAIRLCDEVRLDRVDVLLTDVVMPGMNGKELSEHLRKQHQNAKVVFMSGYTQDVLVRSGLEKSEIPLLSKPFSLSDLVATIRDTLEIGAD